MSNNTTFDDDEKIQILIKKSFQVPATYEQTKWFNEAKGVSRTILEASDINSKTVPTTPIWDDASLNETDLESYGIKLDPTQNFAASPYDEIHTFANATYSSYSKTISIDPGAYIDSTGTVMLFVKLKLDRMDTPSPSAIAYTKYHIDSSQNSILDNAYQFNYNQQRNVLDSNDNFISLFKPYAYYLQLSTDGGSNFELLTPEHGNWFFDFKSGIITFSDDPNDSTFGTDAKDVTNGDLYFTFVKYVGPRGLDKLIDVSDNFDSNATSGFYENQIVVDSANSEIYLFKNSEWNSIGGGGSGGSEDSIYQPMYAIRNNVSSMSDFENLFGVTFETYDGTSLEVTDGNTTASTTSTLSFNSEDKNYADNATLIIKYKIDNYPNDASSAILYEAGGNGAGLVIGFKQKNNLVVYGGQGTDWVGTEAVSNLFGENSSFDISQYENETNIIGLDISFVQGTNSTIADFKLYFNNVLIGETYSHDLTTTYIWGSDDAGLGMYASAINQVFESDLTNITPLGLEVGSFVGVLLGSVYEDYSFYDYKMLDISGLNVDGEVNISSNLTVGGVLEASYINSDVVFGANNATIGEHSVTASAFYAYNSNGTYQVTTRDSQLALIANNANGIGFYVNNLSDPGDEAVRINQNGNVAIGKIAASEKLDVSGSANISSDLTVGANLNLTGLLVCDNSPVDSFINRILLYDATSSGTDYGIGIKANTLTYHSNQKHEFIYGSTTTTAGTTGMTLDQSNLTVEGDLSVGSNLTVGGDIVADAGDVYAKYGFVITGSQGSDSYFSSYDGAFWRQDSQVVITVDDNLYIKHKEGGSLDNAGFRFNVTGTKTDAKLGIGTGTSTLSYPLHINNTVTDSSVTMYMVGNAVDNGQDYDGSQNSGWADNKTSNKVIYWYQKHTIADLSEYDIDANAESGGLLFKYTDTTTIPISVYSTGAFVSEQTFATTSDRRIKTNIVDISDDEALVQFRKLQPKKYNYIDFKKKTTQQVYGFIAQEIAQEIPNSTTQTCDFIPDLYCYGEVDVCNNTIKLLQKSIIIDSSNQNIVIRDVSLNVDLSLNDTLKCYDASNDEFEIEISNIEIVDNEYILTIDASNIELSKHSYYNIGDASGNILHNNLVFIYGKKVDDLHHLKKDSIWTVAAAALQEVDRQQQADKVRIAELEKEVTTLKNQVSTFETQMSELLARITSLETTTDGS